MALNPERSFLAVALFFGCLVVAAPATVEAQRDYRPLFDKFNFKLEGSWVGLNTEIRLDSGLLGRATTLNFEDDLDLGNREQIPTLAFEWQIARKHKLAVRWQDIDRGSNTQALTEIRWGNEIIPVDADITLGFDITQTFVDYAYYPWSKERWAAGFGLGFRWIDLQATLAYHDEGNDVEGSSDVRGSAPLPYVYFEYRRLLSDRWRIDHRPRVLLLENRRHRGRPVDCARRRRVPGRQEMGLWCGRQSVGHQRRLERDFDRG